MGGGHQSGNIIGTLEGDKASAFELTSDIAAVGFQVAVEVALTKGAGSTLRTVSTRSAKKPVPSGSAIRAKASVDDKRISTKNKERGITVESSSGANPHAQARHPARTRPTTPPAPERRPVVVKQQTRQNVEQDRIQRVAAQFGCACFAPGTLVATPHGLTPIEHLQVGDLVLSMDELTGEVAFKPIAETFVTPDKEMIQVAVTTPDGDTEVITTTPGHPFWVSGIGWTHAGDLRAGDQVVSANSISDAGAMALLASGQATLYEVAAVSQVVRRGTVFNFEVQDFHTYFVGHSGAWVHNTSKCGSSRAAPNAVASGLTRSQTKRSPIRPRRGLEEAARIRQENGLGAFDGGRGPRNVGIADADVNGLRRERLISISGKTPPTGLVQTPSSRLFATVPVPTRGGRLRSAAFDSEALILEKLGRRLDALEGFSGRPATGVVRLFSERPVCPSCTGVLKQFQDRFPGVRLLVSDGTTPF